MIDLSGKRFGKLRVIERAGTKRQSATSTVVLWKCVCDCGNERITHTSRLTGMRTLHCGEYKCRVRPENHHGYSKTRTHNSWENMISRCTRPSYPSYEHYKARGITVCDRWQTFVWFLYDMGECPEGLTLDRIDNTGNYEPGNCRWATRREQANNRITNLKFEYNGETYTMAELARATGVNKETLRWRLVRPGGWSVADAVDTPTIPRHLRKAGLSKR